MTEALKGKTVDEARALFDRFHDMVTSSPETAAPDLGKLSVLAGRARVSDANQVRESGLAHAEGRGRGRRGSGEHGVDAVSDRFLISSISLNSLYSMRADVPMIPVQNLQTSPKTARRTS